MATGGRPITERPSRAILGPASHEPTLSTDRSRLPGGDVPALASVVARFTDRPGALAGVLRRMADAGLNVKFAYFGSRNRIVVGTGDPRRALELLAGG